MSEIRVHVEGTGIARVTVNGVPAWVADEEGEASAVTVRLVPVTRVERVDCGLVEWRVKQSGRSSYAKPAHGSYGKPS